MLRSNGKQIVKIDADGNYYIEDEVSEETAKNYMMNVVMNHICDSANSELLLKTKRDRELRK